jgi:hypothetical protein
MWSGGPETVWLWSYRPNTAARTPWLASETVDVTIFFVGEMGDFGGQEKSPSGGSVQGIIPTTDRPRSSKPNRKSQQSNSINFIDHFLNYFPPKPALKSI